MRAWQAAVLVALCCRPSSEGPAAPPSLDALAEAVRSEVNPLKAMEYMGHIYSTDRWFTFPKFGDTAEYEASAMRRAGLQRVEILRSPADGQTQAGFWTMPLAWDIRRGRLEIESPALPMGDRLLADYSAIPTSVGMWSGATPADGITAEVVELKTPSREEIGRMDLRGKFVLTADDLRDFKWMLVGTGAIGTISAFTENPDFRDGREWINSWGDWGWAFTKKSTPLVSFSISPRQLGLLRGLLAKGPVKVRALVDTRYYTGSYPLVTGVIPGSGSDEEVLMLGHSFEQGAGDNATGVAAMLEAMGTIQRLIESGRLPRPKRTIRMLTTAEIYGSLPYVLAHRDRVQRTVAATCVDSPAPSYEIEGGEYNFYGTPDAGRSFVDALLAKIAETYFSKVRRPWHAHAYDGGGGDVYLNDPMIGVPTVWTYTKAAKITHHNSEDRPDREDARSLRDLSAVTAIFAYSIAAAGEREASWMGELALMLGYEQVLAAAAQNLDQVAAAVDEGALRAVLRDGLEKTGYTVKIEKQAVVSAVRLCDGCRANLEKLALRLDRFGEEQDSTLRDAVNRRAAALGLQVPVAISATPDDPQTRAAARLVVRRKRPGTIPLDDLSPANREGYPSGAWSNVAIMALYWCDGRRSVADVARLTRLELGPIKFDFAGYFRFLAQHGYVELTEMKMPR